MLVCITTTSLLVYLYYPYGQCGMEPSLKTGLLQAKFFDTSDGHTACRVHQKMAIAAAEPGIPARWNPGWGGGRSWSFIHNITCLPVFPQPYS